jgi:hypothetical protein
VFRKSEGKGAPGRSRREWKRNIKTDVEDVG